MGKAVVVFISLAIMTMVAAIGALPSLFWGMSINNYLSIVAILIAAQTFIGGCWNYYVDMKNRLETKKIEAANALANSIQHVQINCAYCGTANMARILVGEQNKFECSACHENNTVLLSCSAARTTTPVMPKANLAEIFKNIS